MAEEPTEKSSTTEGDSKKKKVTRIISVIVGIICIAAGFFSFSDSDELNNALIEVGAGQTVSNVIAEHPEISKYAGKVADVIEAAIEARTTSPERLTSMIVESLGEHIVTVPGLSNFIHLIVETINKQYDKSANEDVYISKLQHLIIGIRDGIAAASRLDKGEE